MSVTSIGPQVGVASAPRPSQAGRPAVAAGAESAEPQEVFQPSNPQVTGSWLTSALKNQKPGSLFVLDDFQPTGGQAIPGLFAAPEWMASHGGHVLDTARQEGFKGQSLPLELNRPLSDEQLQAKYGKMTELWKNGKTPEDLRTSLYERAVVNRTRLLDNATQSLDDLSEAGAHNSVVNISASGSQAATTNNLLRMMIPKDPNDPDSVASARAERAKFAQAFGVNDADLSSDNQEIQGAARQKLFQGVVDLVGSTQKDPRFIHSKSEYESAVQHFEAGYNSVVVASGNDGPVEQFWEKATYGRKLQVPSEFTVNDLGVDAATVVGATRDWEGKPYPAEYNNVYNGLDMYANGYAGNGKPGGEEGSSFAAPKVAVALAGLHAKFPSLSSSQVENLMRNRLTGSLPDYYGAKELPSLDDSRTSAFLEQGTF